MSVVVVGSANVDLFVRGQRLPEPGETVFADTYDELPGGKGLNQAVAAARAGAEVAFFCAVGDDSGADFLADFLGTEPLTLSATVTSSPTGRAIIQVDANAENSIMVVGGANLAAASFDGSDFESELPRQAMSFCSRKCRSHSTSRPQKSPAMLALWLC